MSSCNSEHSEEDMFIQRIAERILAMCSEATTRARDPEPNIPFPEFLSILAERGNLRQEVFIHALVLLERLCNVSGQPMTSNNVYRITLVAIIVSVGVLEDYTRGLSNWSTVICRFYSTRSLAVLESQFLGILNFDILVRRSQYESICTQLCETSERLLTPASKLEIRIA